MFYIKSGNNPADLSTKFSKFQNTYKILGDGSLFRQGPECLKKGIEEAIRCNELVPIDRISPSTKEQDLAALEIVKLHQLVITDHNEEELEKSAERDDALKEEDIDDAVACLIMTNNDTIGNESWLNRKRSGYRAQKATITVKERISKVEEFSNYLISPLKKDTIYFSDQQCVYLKQSDAGLKKA